MRKREEKRKAEGKSKRNMYQYIGEFLFYQLKFKIIAGYPVPVSGFRIAGYPAKSVFGASLTKMCIFMQKQTIFMTNS